MLVRYSKNKYSSKHYYSIQTFITALRSIYLIE